MDGWPMGVRFMGHAAFPRVRAVANVGQGLCGALKVVKTATGGPCCVSSEECAVRGAMATHGTIQPHGATLYSSYHSSHMWRHQHYCLRCWRTVRMNHNAGAYATMQQGACKAYDRPLTATHAPIATNPGSDGTSLCTQRRHETAP